MKVAYVNLSTGIVENLMIVNRLDDEIPEGYKLVEIPVTQGVLSPEQVAVNAILEQIDPKLVKTAGFFEQVVHIGVTKWSEEQGFYE